MATRTVSSFGGSPAPPLRASDHLFVVLSCVDPFDLPSRHGLHGIDEVRIGRGDARATTRGQPDRELTIKLADCHVSKLHARLVRGEGGWDLVDASSKNGTFLGGVRVERARLADGDVIQVGHTLLIFRCSLPTPTDAASDLTATAQVEALATLLPSLARELDRLCVVARSSTPILLISETGTGKEVLARAVHLLSRRPGSFVPIHCGGLPPMLVDSVLFGHRRGSFSGAVGDHSGLLRAADRGTVLLDEVGDMPVAVQVAVLRALQDGEVLPVGGTHPMRVDARVVAATHHDLEAAAEAGRFREDLLARLSGFTFRLPPLRERREDIGLFVRVFLQRRASTSAFGASLSPEVGMRLLRHTWPRNVRELEKCIQFAAAIAGERRIELDCLPTSIGEGAAAARESRPATSVRLVALLRESRGNVSRVAEALGTSRSQVRRLMERAALDADEFR